MQIPNRTTLTLSDCSQSSFEKIIVWLVKESEPSASFWDFSDIIKYVSLKFNRCPISLVNLIKEDPEKVDAFYEIIGTIDGKIDDGVLQLLKGMVKAITPVEERILSKRSDKRLRNIVDIFELGETAFTFGERIDEYLRSENKKEYMNTVRYKLSAVKNQDTVSPRESLILKAERFNSLSECASEPVTILSIDFDKMPKLRWLDDNNVVPECVQIFMVNSFFTTLDTKIGIDLGPYRYDQIKSTLSKKVCFQALINDSSLFDRKSFAEFIEAMAEILVELNDELAFCDCEELDTKYIRRALPVFGFLGTDECFCIFHEKGLLRQIESLRESEGITS